MIDKKRLESAAEILYADLQFARAEAIKRNKLVQVSFHVDGSDWCYGLKVDAYCDCQQTDHDHLEFCQLDKDEAGHGIPTSVSSTEFKDISIAISIAITVSHFSFSPLRGTVNNGSAEFQSANNKKLQVVVSRFGRVRLCSPSGEGNINSYPAC
jgi:type IV fimbrial biogenesis protein FimT